MRAPKLFLDANVLFAAAVTPKGRAQALFALAEGGSAQLVSSPYALGEARRNVAAKYPDMSERLERYAKQLTVVPEASPSLVAWARAHLPAKDAPILAAAVRARADLLVTGDRVHFGVLYGTTLQGTEVVTLAAALDRLLEE